MKVVLVNEGGKKRAIDRAEMHGRVYTSTASRVIGKVRGAVATGDWMIRRMGWSKFAREVARGVVVECGGDGKLSREFRAEEAEGIVAGWPGTAHGLKGFLMGEKRVGVMGVAEGVLVRLVEEEEAKDTKDEKDEKDPRDEKDMDSRGDVDGEDDEEGESGEGAEGPPSPEGSGAAGEAPDGEDGEEERGRDARGTSEEGEGVTEIL